MENFEKEGDIFNCKLLLEDGYIFPTALHKDVGKRVNHRLKELENKDNFPDNFKMNLVFINDVDLSNFSYTKNKNELYLKII